MSLHRSLLPLVPLLVLASPAMGQAKPRFINPAGMPAPHGYSQVVDVPPGSRLLFLSGQVPLDSAGQVRGSGDFRAQAIQVFENLQAGLKAGGAGFGDVVKLNFYLVDVGQLATLREVRDRYVNAASPPASTLVEVRRLFRDDVQLEVDAVAVVRH